MVDDYASESSGQLVMPFYLICDVSLSMQSEMGTLHAGVTRLQRAIIAEPILDDVARVCVMTFSDEVEILLPMARMSGCGEIPQFPCQNTRNAQYGKAFDKLAETMKKDYVALRRGGWNVYRPCAYFLTSADPSDRNWRQSFEATLTRDPMDRRGVPYPIFVPFGFGNAQRDTLRRLAYPPDVSKWYHARNAMIEDALEGVLDIIKNSVVTSSSQSKLFGQPEHILPEPGPRSSITCGVAAYDSRT